MVRYTTAHTDATTDARQLRRVAAASAIGTTIEWYDYFIYSTAAALIFGSQFFSALSWPGRCRSSYWWSPATRRC